MADPPIKGQLESDALGNNPPDVQAQLDAALANDFAHIMPGTRSGAVASVQTALGRITKNGDGRIPVITDDPGHFGPLTVAAVHAFKSTRFIQRTGQRLDDVVGRMTLTQLDNENVVIDGKTPPPAPVKTFKDVVVQIIGFGGTNSPVQGQQQGSGVLRADVTSPEYKAKTNRSLEAIVFTGGQQPNPTTVIAQLVRAAALAPGVTPGLICLFGGSAGGKNVLQLADELSTGASSLPIAYLGSSDGAFSDADAVAPPNRAGTNLLIAKRGLFGAAETVNIFQSAGNGFTNSILDSRRVWQGKMPNGEVHGPIQGFQVNRDLTREGIVKEVGPNTNFEALHATAVSIGDGVHIARIRALLSAA